MTARKLNPVNQISKAAINRATAALPIARRATILPRLTEKEFQAQVVETAILHGWKVFHPFSSSYSAKGYPDLTLARHGVVIWAELKGPNGKLTGAQRAWLKALPEGHAFVWWPSDWDSIVKVLK